MTSGSNIIKIIVALRKEYNLDFNGTPDPESERKIRKQLKVRVQLEKDITVNDVAVIIHLIQNEQTNLLYLFHDKGCLFLSLLTYIEELPVLPHNQKEKTVKNESFALFLEQYFLAPLQLYINDLATLNHYKGLYLLLTQETSLPPKLISSITALLNNKLDFAISTISSRKKVKPQSIEYIFNPYFYRCFNIIDEPLSFDLKIGKLSDGAMEKRKLKKRYELAFLFSAGVYNAFDQQLQGILKHNQEVAFEKNTQEFHSGYKSFKGGVNKLKKFLFSEDIRLKKKIMKKPHIFSKSRKVTYVDIPIPDPKSEKTVREAIHDQRKKALGYGVILILFAIGITGLYLDANKGDTYNKGVQLIDSIRKKAKKKATDSLHQPTKIVLPEN